MPLIDDLITIVQDRQTQQLSALLERFNPFDVLRIGHYELRHTNTLAWLLDPAGNHGLNQTFLRAFIKVLDARQGDFTLSKCFEAAEDQSVMIFREVRPGKIKKSSRGGLLGLDDTDVDIDESNQNARRGGAVDIVVQGEDWILAIEAKVRSTEGDDQLSKYKKSISKYAEDSNFKFFLVYLTVNGEAPGDNDWQIATWSDQVIDPLETVLSIHQSLQPEVRHFIESYRETLRRHAGVGGEVERIASIIAEKYQHQLGQLQKKRRGRTQESLTPAEKRVIRHHSMILHLLLDQLVTPQAERAEVIRTLLKARNFRILRGAASYIPFIPNGWDQNFNILADRNDANVVFVFVNRPPNPTIKLQIRNLENTDDAQREYRKKLVSLVQETKDDAIFNGAFLTRRGNEDPQPRQPTGSYFSIYIQPVNIESRETNQVAKSINNLLDQISNFVLPKFNELMQMSGLKIS